MFSEQLKVLRNSRGLSQRDLCKIFCVSSGAIAMWETGKRQPDLSTLCKLADYFNVTVDYLLGREDKEKTPIQPHKTVVQALFDELSPFEQGQIVERMKIMLEHRNIDYEKIIATCG